MTVQADGEFEVAGIEIHQMVGTGRGNVVQKFLGQITVRVNHANAMSEGDVLQDQIAEQGRLARRRFCR